MVQTKTEDSDETEVLSCKVAGWLVAVFQRLFHFFEEGRESKE